MVRGVSYCDLVIQARLYITLATTLCKMTFSAVHFSWKHAILVFLILHLVVSSCCRYFSALSKGECLPVKERLEMKMASQTTDTGLTPGLLKVLHKQVIFSSSQMHIHLVVIW